MAIDYKRASWIELFYDVAFVALVAQLTYLAYEHHHSISDLLYVFIIGYVIFLAWWATTANRNMQPTETGADKFFIQLQMVGAFLMSLTMPDVFAGNVTGFFATLAAVRVLQAFMMVRMYFFHPETRPNTYNILQGFFVGAGLWLLAAFAPAPYHLIAALTALVIDVMTPLTRGKGNTKRYLNVYHLQERLGLFLMLVIGESMIVVALTNTAGKLSVVEPAVVFSGLAMMIALWWLYFEHGDLHQGVRPRNLFLFLHAHGFMFGSIILLSVGYKLAIEFSRSPEALLFIVVGSAGVAITLVVIRVMLHSSLSVVLRRASVFLLAGGLIVGAGIYFTLVLETIIALTALFAGAALYDRLTDKADEITQS